MKRAPVALVALVALVAMLDLAVVAGCSGPAPLPQPPAPPAAPAPRPLPPSERADLALRIPGLLRDSAFAVVEGAGPMSVLAADVVAEGDRLGAFVDLEPDGCLLVLARGTEGVDDIDLVAFSDDGAPLAMDEASDPRPAFVMCPPLPARAYVMARVAAGRGIVGLGAQRVPMASAARVASRVGARSRTGDSARDGEAWPGLDAKAQLHRRDQGARWEEVRRVAIPVDSRAPGRIGVPIEAGRCLSILATPSDETSDIEVTVQDGEGRVVGRAQEIGRDRVVVLCSSLPGTIGIDVRPRLSSGIAAIVVARSVAGSEADLVARPERIDPHALRDLAGARAAAGARLERAGLPRAQSSATGTAHVGRRAVTTVSLPRGCARVDVIAGAPLAGLSADLWTESGVLLSRGEASAEVALFACGEGGKARLDVEALGRPGPFAVEVREERKTDPALLGAPVAATRLLGRFNAGGGTVRAEELAAPRAVTFDASRMSRVELRIPERKCLDVGAAVGPGGSGVDVRLVDVQTQSELALARGMFATVARACAGTSARPIAVELRLDVGKADGLVAAHARDEQTTK